MNKGKNPCDVCDTEHCDDCALNIYALEHECCNYQCFLNYDGTCIISLFEKCGAWKKG